MIGDRGATKRPYSLMGIMNRLSLRQKLFGLGLLGVVATVVVALVASRGLSRLTTTAQLLENTVRVQRSQMQADMMHDALHSTVLAAHLKSADAAGLRGGSATTFREEATTNGADLLASAAPYSFDFYIADLMLPQYAHRR